MNKFYSILKCLPAVVLLAGAGVFSAGAEVTPKATEGQSMLFGYCGNPRGGLVLSKQCFRAGALRISDLISERFDGCRISGVQIANGQLNGETSDIKVFFSRALDEEPFYTFDSNMDFDSYEKYKEHIVPADVVINKGEPLFVGYTIWDGNEVKNGKRSTPVLLDGQPSSEPGGFEGAGDVADPEKMTWYDQSGIYGMMCIKLRIEGENLPVDLVEISSLTVSDYVAPGQTARAAMTIKNCGLNSVKSIELTYELDNGEQTFRKTYPLPISSGKTNSATSVSAPCLTVGNNIPFKVRVSKVNDREPGKGAIMAREGYLLCMEGEEGYKRNMVVEEVTSLSCGWCPRGITGMAAMVSEHPDGTFIPICVSSTSDPDTYKTGVNYSDIWNVLSGMPSCMVNRHMSRFGIGDPNEAALRRNYTSVRSVPGVAKIALGGMEVSGQTATLSSTVTFALDEEDADYRIAYVVTENNVGPNLQLNYYSGGGSGVMGGWESKDPYVETYHNHFARAISEFGGEEGSVPSEIEAGKEYAHSGTVDLSQVTDMNNIHLIAMVINHRTGAIENAVTITPEELAGIGEVEADSTAGAEKTEYFDLQGRPVASPEVSGIYIRLTGDKAEKVVVK
ncbi:MAG: Omp28-related outer membrane protein [Muribaculaceae bacterium]|nr:Omp28-related outer membrane protein [Muribaculaceae bacterium]